MQKGILMKKKVISHLKKDIDSCKHEGKEDRKLIKDIKNEPKNSPKKKKK